jgi:hypothetical protein
VNGGIGSLSLALAMLGPLSGCALINAASGGECVLEPGQEECCDDGEDNDGDGMTDCGDPACFGSEDCGGSGGGGNCQITSSSIHVGEPPIENMTVNTCDQTFVLNDPHTCGPAQNVAVIQFHSPIARQQEICVNYDVGGTGSLSADRCGDSEGECISLTGSCVSLNLEQRDYFLVVPSSTGPGCGDLQITVHDPGGGGGGSEICLNGADDNAAGGTDCEDGVCRAGGACNHPFGGQCDGVDNENIAGFPVASIDEVSCRCVNDEGCDQIPSGASAPYVCHTGVGPGGVCAPDCNTTPWCGPLGLTCGGNGRCS